MNYIQPGARQIEIFRSLFKGREDVFARYWKKGNKSGYMPAYFIDRYMYNLHKIRGGTFSNYKDKTRLPLTDMEVLNHLEGKQLIGIYPLLDDNSSWFIAADFDKERWAQQSISLIRVLADNGIPAYLERSKSGKGGHVWVFFDKPYPAVRGRKIMNFFLERSGVASIFDKNSSFDRLFPNQDRLSGEKLGNLIALPLYKTALISGNSLFIDEDLEPYPNQWEFLQCIKKVNSTHLDEIYSTLPGKNTVRGGQELSLYQAGAGSNHIIGEPGQIDLKYSSDKRNSDHGKLRVNLSNKIFIPRKGIKDGLAKFIRDELNFANSEYFARKKAGRSTYGIPGFFNLIEESEEEVALPRGFIGKLLRHCKQAAIEVDFVDGRKKLDEIEFSANFSLREHQKRAVETARVKDFGVITAPPASGKTVIGLQIIASKKQPALVVVHRKQLMEQWVERIQAFLGIPSGEIGRLGQGKFKPGKAVTVAMIQSLGKYLEKIEGEELKESFGTVIIDECQHIPAESYRKTISKINSYYQYGLTATPFRKGNDGKLIFAYLGEIIDEIKPQETDNFKKARVVIRETSLSVPYNPKTDTFETLSRILIHDSERNRLILKDVSEEVNKGRKAVIITERKEHIETLNQFLNKSFETITLSGDDPDHKRKAKWKMLTGGNYQVLITTGQFFGEGSDLQNASSVFLCYPFSFRGKLIQYIGRVQRSEITPVIYDYRDIKIEFLDRMFLKRNVYYRNFEKHATLFDDHELPLSPPDNVSVIDKKIRVPVEELDFLYGAVAFKYSLSGTEIKSDPPHQKLHQSGQHVAQPNDLKKADAMDLQGRITGKESREERPESAMTEIRFEIENENMRPEFDVLKPYFIRLFRSRSVEVSIYAELRKGRVLANMASCDALEKLNREIIESVRFRFIEKEMIGRRPDKESSHGMLNLEQWREQEKDHGLFLSEEKFLNEVLSGKKYLHGRN